MKTKAILLLLVLGSLHLQAQESVATRSGKIQKGMVKVSILYPNEEGKTFDMDYYAQKHMPMVAGLFGDALQAWSVERGISGRTPDEPVPFVAIGYFYFNQLSDYENVFGPNAEKILGDIPNYTNIQPQVQISEVVE